MDKKQNVTDRLGEVFNQERLFHLYESLDKATLPRIPTNASLSELNLLLGLIGNKYAYLQTKLGYVRAEKHKIEHKRHQEYNKAYRNAETHMPKTTQAILRMVAEATPDVAELDNKLADITCYITTLEAKTTAYSILDQDVRKLLTSYMCVETHPR